MLEELQKLELMSLNLSSELMLAAGALMLGGGLCVWLGGMRWRFLTAILVGLLAGAAGTLIVSRQFSGQTFGIAGAAGFVYVILFRKRGMVFAGAVLAALICVMATVGISSAEQAELMPNPDFPLQVEDHQRLTAQESLGVLKSQFFYFGRILSSILQNVSVHGIILAAVAAALITAAGIFLSRIVSSVSTAAVGTVFIFAGMVVMLLQKGAAPITVIYQKSMFYQNVAIFMIIFGAITGVMLCPERRKMPEADNDDKGET